MGHILTQKVHGGSAEASKILQPNNKIKCLFDVRFTGILITNGALGLVQNRRPRGFSPLQVQALLRLYVRKLFSVGERFPARSEISPILA